MQLVTADNFLVILFEVTHSLVNRTESLTKMQAGSSF